MATAQLGAIRTVFDRLRGDAGGDGELLTRYRTFRDPDAFGSLVRRHGPMVLGVCRRVLRNAADADDAFQATFLVLARKADAVRPPDRLAPWLYGVAFRTALKARGRAVRRTRAEQEYAAEVAARGEPNADAADLLPVIDEHLNALPEKYRVPLVLCGIRGLNKAQAATKLGVPEGTVSSRLARAREMLRDRLTRRGIAVPGAAFAALLTADTLQAAVPRALAETAAAAATGITAAPATVLTLSHEVIRSMTLLKLQFLGAAALSLSLAAGWLGLVALRADDKKPVKPVGDKPAAAPQKPGEQPAKPRPEGDKPKPAAPDDEKKPLKKPAKLVGKIVGVNPADRTITIPRERDSGTIEEFVKVAADAKITVDGKPAELKDVPKGAIAACVLAGTKEGAAPEITDLAVTGPTVTRPVKQVDATSLTLDGGEGGDKVFKLTPDTRVTIAGQDAKPTDLKVGYKAAVTLTADGAAVLTVITGTKPDGEKPEKPGARPKMSGRVASVDAATRVVTLTAKGEGGEKQMVVKLTADAKITIDGKDAKITDLAKGMTAAFLLSSAKDGQTRESNEVVVAGPTFGGTIKQVDAASVTIGSEKLDRVVKLAVGGKVTVNGKEATLADLKAGDKATVTLTSDESAAVLIASGTKKGDGDKPKPDKEDEDE